MKIIKDQINKNIKMKKGGNTNYDKSKILRRKVLILEKEISNCEDQISILRMKLQRGIKDLSS
jgi:hypothetical protein